jgi:pimeloyl-ACP methyl ester carboxylesterase
MLVRYDVRGARLSDRGVSDYSLEAHLLDVQAVVDRLGLERFALLGAADAGPVAIAYAARHPERVSQLLPWCAWARGADVQSPRIGAWRRLPDHDWELRTETCAHLALGWCAGDVGRVAAQHLRRSTTREGLQVSLDAAVEFDATPLLSKVDATALVLHRREIAWRPVSIARELAASLSKARLTLFGQSAPPYLGDSEALAQAGDDFLADQDEPPAAPHPFSTVLAGVRSSSLGAALPTGGSSELTGESSKSYSSSPAVAPTRRLPKTWYSVAARSSVTSATSTASSAPHGRTQRAS